jgi:hypothetical protein
MWSMKILGSPVMMLLSLAGLLAFPIRERKIPQEGFLAAVTAIYIFALLSMQGVGCVTYSLFPSC